MSTPHVHSAADELLAQVKEQSNWRDVAAEEQDGTLDPIAEVTAAIGARGSRRSAAVTR